MMKSISTKYVIWTFYYEYYQSGTSLDSEIKLKAVSKSSGKSLLFTKIPKIIQKEFDILKKECYESNFRNSASYNW